MTTVERDQFQEVVLNGETLVFITIVIDHFCIAVTAFYNDSGLTMKLNIPKFQCNFTVFTTAYIVRGVTSRSLSQVFLNIYQQKKANTVKLSPLSLLKAATSDVKMVYCCDRCQSRLRFCFL